MIVIRLRGVRFVILVDAVRIRCLRPNGVARHHLRRYRIKTRCRNLLGWPLAGIDDWERIARRRIVQRWELTGKKASLLHQVGGHSEVVGDTVIEQQPLVIREEEGFVANDRTTQRTTELVGTIRSFGLRLPLNGVQAVATKELVRRSMKLI